jgi:hypothetical protein
MPHKQGQGMPADLGFKPMRLNAFNSEPNKKSCPHNCNKGFSPNDHGPDGVPFLRSQSANANIPLNHSAASIPTG